MYETPPENQVDGNLLRITIQHRKTDGIVSDAVNMNERNKSIKFHQQRKEQIYKILENKRNQSENR